MSPKDCLTSAPQVSACETCANRTREKNVFLLAFIQRLHSTTPPHHQTTLTHTHTEGREPSRLARACLDGEVAHFVQFLRSNAHGSLGAPLASAWWCAVLGDHLIYIACFFVSVYRTAFFAAFLKLMQTFHLRNPCSVFAM